ncbi:MAG: DUF6240 domain-containing protein [Anaerocolumna sp.]
MNINGVYGNNNLTIQEKAVNTVQKEEKETSAVKNNNTIEIIPAIAETGSITYAEDDIHKKTEEDQKEEETKEEEHQNNTSERMTKEDYKEINKEGISLKEYNSERLTRALQRIKTQRTEKEENLNDQKESLDNKTEAAKGMGNYNASTKKIVQKLIDSDLPVTEANIAKIATAMEMAATAFNLSDTSMKYLIRNNLEPTTQNMYKAGYSGSFSQKEEISDQVFTSLQGQIKEIIDNAGLVVNEENVQSAKWLLNNQLPLTENTLWAYRDLKQLKANMNEDTILDKTVEAFASGKTPEAASFGNAVAERARQAITDFQSISDEAIQETVKTHGNGIDQINCRELKKAQGQLDKQDKNTENTELENEAKTIQDKSGEAVDNVDIRTITVRRQLEEIRLKMTLDSGQQLIRQGINPDTDSISKIVDGLKEIEDKYYKNLLKEGSAEVNTENVQALKTSINGIEELKGLPSYILGSTLSNRNIETVNGLLSTGTKLKNTFNKAGEAYESLMTRPRSDMGDSITKAFRNVDGILEDMKLEPTQANERAVRVLGYNEISINDENIQYVKSYDQQVNQLMKSFHPAVAVELIKTGINPLNVPIGELNQQIEGIKGELGIQEDEKYSKYLWKLEKNKGITENEKKSYIGIYRLLNAVEKTDGAALGAVLKADQEVTMQNLLTAVRTIKGSGVDTTVDDNFGSLTQITYSRESITEQLNTSFKVTDQPEEKEESSGQLAGKTSYSHQLIKNVLDEITPDKLQTLGKPEDILNMSVEKLKEELEFTPENTEAESNYWNQKLEEYHEVTDQSDNAQKLLKSYGIPDSLPNIQAAKDLLSKDQTFYKQLNKMIKAGNVTGEANSENLEQPMDDMTGILDLSNISEDFIEALTSPAGMKGQYQKLEQDFNKLINQSYTNPVITSQDITTLQRISYGMSFVQKLASKESYEIPLTVGDNITNVNVTILRNTGDSGKVNINVDSESLGRVMANLSVKDKGVNALITCDNRTGLNAMINESQELKEGVARSGIEMKQLNYGIGNKMSDSYRYTNHNAGNDILKSDATDKTEVTTDTLYKLAKTFLIHIKETENNLQ